jgi:aryl-alcohol dehydrogenase-like predicted oxidoreductase
MAKGRSEVQLGEALRELGAQAIITTKVEIMPEHLGMIALRVRESVEASLRRLQMPSVDIVQIHNPPALQRDERIRVWTPVTVQDVLGPGGALEALRQLRDEGRVRFATSGSRANPPIRSRSESCSIPVSSA